MYFSSSAQVILSRQKLTFVLGKLSVKGVKRVFREEGTEVFQVDQLQNGQVVYISLGEDFI